MESSIPHASHKLLIEFLSDPTLRARLEALRSPCNTTSNPDCDMSGPPPYSATVRDFCAPTPPNRNRPLAGMANEDMETEDLPDYDDENEAEDAGYDDRDTIHISATTTIRGTGNKVSVDIAAMAARLVPILTAMLSPHLPAPVQGGEVGTQTPAQTPAQTQHGAGNDRMGNRQRRKFKINLDCGVSVVGDRNVVGGVSYHGFGGPGGRGIAGPAPASTGPGIGAAGPGIGAAGPGIGATGPELGAGSAGAQAGPVGVRPGPGGMGAAAAAAILARLKTAHAAVDALDGVVAAGTKRSAPESGDDDADSGVGQQDASKRVRRDSDQ